MSPMAFVAGAVFGTSLLLAGTALEQALAQLLYGPPEPPTLDLAPYRLADPTPDDADWRVYAARVPRRLAYDPMAILADSR